MSISFIDISQFPRATYASPYLDFPVENTYGYSLKIALRKAAKKTKYYFIPVQPIRYGRTDSGEKIPVSTLGRWAFGVQGYMGHCLFDGGRKNIRVYVPAWIPELVEMFKLAVEKLKDPLREDYRRSFEKGLVKYGDLLDELSKL